MVLYVSTTKFLPGLHVNGAGQIYFGVSEVILKSRHHLRQLVFDSEPEMTKELI